MMFIRDTVPPGFHISSTVSTHGDSVTDWQSDSKNANGTQYARYDNPGSYTYTTPPLRPGTTYYVGVYAKTDSNFSVTSVASTAKVGIIPELDFYTGTVNTSIPANDSVVYRFHAPAEATRIKWSSVHPGTVQIRMEQGTLPETGGIYQHYYSTGANSSVNMPLAATWPWLKEQTYYVRIVNTSATAVPVSFKMEGENGWIGSDTYSGWAGSAFTPAQLANAAISGGMADPDRDGIVNLLEFLLGGSPSVPGSSILPTVTSTTQAEVTTMTFQYKRKIAAVDVIQIVEHTGDLTESWAPAINGQSGVSIIATPVDASTEQVTVKIPSASGTRFVRLRASR